MARGRFLDGECRAGARFNVLPVARIPSLWAWYDAAAILTIANDAGSAAHWLDISGNRRHLIAGTAGATGSRQLNGLNVIDFNGSTQYMTATAVFPTGAYTIFVVTGSDDAPTTFERAMAFINASTANDYDNDNSTAITIGDNTKTFFVFQGAVSLSTGGSGATPIGTWIVRKGVGTNEYQITDTAASTSQTTNTSSGQTSGGSLIVGAGFESSVVARHNDGPFGELIIFTSTLTDTERDAVRAYLVTKWGA